MRWTIVAIDTIHLAFVTGGNLLCREGTGAIVVLSDVSLPIFDAYPRNNLPMLISRNICNLVGDIHVPVDSRHQPGGRTAAADIYQHSQLTHGVLFVVTIVGNHL